MDLPKGVWLEKNRPNGRRDRFRVRLYRNHIEYHAGYFYTLEEAMLALDSLQAHIEVLHTKRLSDDVPIGTLVGITQAMEQERRINPRAARVRRE